MLCSPLDPWQEFVSIHGLELLPDGRPRFRVVLLLVSRQNGKTELPVRLSLWWQFVCLVPLILGTSTKLDYAKESWMKAVKLAEKAPGIPVTRDDRKRWTRQANGEQESWHTTEDGDDCRYKIAASNEEGGRSLTINRLVLDELRQHHTYDAWAASVPAVNAVRDGQVWAMSNQGDVRSVVLNDKRAAALKYMKTGEGDRRLGLFEYSAPDGSDPLDIEALAYANPNLGATHDHGLDPEVLLGDAETAVAAGGEALAKFKIECMCMAVPMLDGAIDPIAWAAGAIEGDLSDVRSRVALCLDVSPDGLHATLAAAAVLEDGRVRVEAVAAWSGQDCTAAMRRDLPGWEARVKPAARGWLQNGPAAALTATLTAWDAIGSDAAAICMGLAEQVTAGQVLHSDDPLLNAHVTGAEKLRTGDRWVFSRRGGGHCDGAYAAAGAVHLARTLPPSLGRIRLVTASRR